MDWHEYLDDMKVNLRRMHRTAPDTMKSFNGLEKAVHDTGVLDAKTKEMVAIGIAIGLRCDPCIGFHIKSLSRAGGTREELADVLGVSIQMGGGPALMYASKALAAWDELIEQKD